MAEPLHTMAALTRAGLTFTGQRDPAYAQRSLLYRMQRVEQAIRVVHWGGGYVVTGIGKSRLSTLKRQYGPVREEA